jgi:hypothetical protein
VVRVIAGVVGAIANVVRVVANEDVDDEDQICASSAAVVVKLLALVV